MAKLTIVFGVLLIVLGVASFVLTGASHPTSLIPAGFGLVLALSGALASGDDAKKRMLWMHIAVTVGLVGFIFPALRLWCMRMRSRRSWLIRQRCIRS